MALDGKRNAHIERARTCAQLTIPHLLPPKDTDENTPLYTPYQAVGSRAVNNLASKLLLVLFPPNSPFFRLDVSPALLAEIMENMDEEGIKSQIQSKLSAVEQNAVRYIEKRAMRAVLHRAVRLLIVTGNALLEFLDDGGLKCYRLDKFCVRRNPQGEPVEIVIRELITEDEVPEGIDQTNLKADKAAEEVAQGVRDDIELYTYAVLRDKRWYLHQEIMGQEVPDSQAEYPKGKCPLVPLIWTLADGEHYGRGHVEEHIGDFVPCEGYNKLLLEGSMAMGKVIYMVSPNGVTRQQDLVECPNGGFVVGNREDVNALQTEKYYDFKVAQEQSLRIEERISRAFLLHESVQRQAERVTAEEIRYMAQELEDALGGIFSVLAHTLQLPMVTRLLHQMSRDKVIPTLPDSVEPMIITGFEALGRGHELGKLRMFREEIAGFGEETMIKMVIPYEYATRVATTLGLDTEGLVPTKEELEAAASQEQEQRQQEMMLNHPATTEMVKAGMEQGAMQPQGE
jgi:hypothetical protein